MVVPPAQHPALAYGKRNSNGFKFQLCRQSLNLLGEDCEFVVYYIALNTIARSAEWVDTPQELLSALQCSLRQVSIVSLQ